MESPKPAVFSALVLRKHGFGKAWKQNIYFNKFRLTFVLLTLSSSQAHTFTPPSVCRNAMITQLEDFERASIYNILSNFLSDHETIFNCLLSDCKPIWFFWLLICQWTAALILIFACLCRSFAHQEQPEQQQAVSVSSWEGRKTGND